ncbi:hypothetical protein [Nocardiopsis sp. FR26]|uniref:hypothetical protein n=1 Tax=Nocardiopsis sp. FR26 TaxID=2605987 RepID=UPI001357E048|nr:hypothetical protein [Nocardiopsis sp. FR26]
MPWDAQDRTRYEDEVLVAARAHGLPADLFTRYGIGPRLEGRLRADATAFAEHVSEVCAHWRDLREHRRSLREVLTDLITEHEHLEKTGALTPDHFDRVRAETARRAVAEWSLIAAGLTTAVVDRDTLRSMTAPVGVDESDAERVLLERGVRVVDRIPDLPDAPPASAVRPLREALRVRGAAFSPMVVFGEQRLVKGFTVLGGFRLSDGTTLDKDTLDDAVQRVRREAETPARNAAENVLEILRADGDAERREALVLEEIVSDMRRQPASVPESALARPWTGRGLDETEAALLAAAVRRSGPRADAAARAERDVRDLLVDNQLRRAQEAAADLPHEHDLHARLRVRVRQVEELTEEADRALRAGDREEAARALAAAVEVASDDEDLAARLGEVQPLPPRGVEARVDGRNVVVTWQPSPSLAGTVTYRVVRRTGRDGKAREVLVGELAGTEITDTGAPVGSEARYTVVAVRGGRGESEPVSTTPVVIAPEVSSLRVCAGEHEVSGSWEAPAEAVRVEVLRGEGAPPRGPGDGVRVETNGTGFRDTDVETDVDYHYRIRAVYVTSNGHARGSAGLVRRASPGPCPDPVHDLSVRSDGGTDFVAAWTRPDRGRVVLRVGTEPPAWPPGTVVSQDDLEAYGHVVEQRPASPEQVERFRSEEAADTGAGAAVTAPGASSVNAGPGLGRTGQPAATSRNEREGVRVLGPSDRGEIAVRNSQLRSEEPAAPAAPGRAGSEEREGVRVLGASARPADGDRGHEDVPSGPPAPREEDPPPAKDDWEGVRVLGPRGKGTDPWEDDLPAPEHSSPEPERSGAPPTGGPAPGRAVEPHGEAAPPTARGGQSSVPAPRGSAPGRGTGPAAGGGNGNRGPASGHRAPTAPGADAPTAGSGRVPAPGRGNGTGPRPGPAVPGGPDRRGGLPAARSAPRTGQPQRRSTAPRPDGSPGNPGPVQGSGGGPRPPEHRGTGAAGTRDGVGTGPRPGNTQGPGTAGPAGNGARPGGGRGAGPAHRAPERGEAPAGRARAEEVWSQARPEEPSGPRPHLARPGGDRPVSDPAVPGPRRPDSRQAGPRRGGTTGPAGGPAPTAPPSAPEPGGGRGGDRGDGPSAGQVPPRPAGRGTGAGTEPRSAATGTRSAHPTQGTAPGQRTNPSQATNPRRDANPAQGTAPGQGAAPKRSTGAARDAGPERAANTSAPESGHTPATAAGDRTAPQTAHGQRPRSAAAGPDGRAGTAPAPRQPARRNADGGAPPTGAAAPKASPRGEARASGRPVPEAAPEAVPEPERARTFAALSLDSGTKHVLAVTVAGDQTVVGTSVRVTAAPPVRGLHAQRFDTAIRLSWTWPDDAVAALVSWRPEAPGAEHWIGGELRCTRRQYDCEGGFEAPMSPDSVKVAVRAVVPFEGGETVSAPVGLTVPGRAVLDYRVEAAGLLRRDRVVQLVAKEDCDIPELVVVYAEGPVQPHSAAQGTELARIPAGHLAAGAWVSVRVRPPRGTGEGWLMCFPADGDAHGIRLRQPPVRELRC